MMLANICKKVLLCLPASLVVSILMSPMAIAGDINIPAYPGSQLETTKNKVEQNHPVITDRMKKVNGVVTSDSAQWLQGQLHRQLYQIVQGHTGESAYRHFTSIFKQMGVIERYSCSSFSCGGSNFWANDIFDIARLYGLDRYQYYFIGERDGQYFSVYTVRRGNGRTYALVDVFSPERGQMENKQQKKPFQDIHMKRPLNQSKPLQMLIERINKNSNDIIVLQLQTVFSIDRVQFDRQQTHTKLLLKDLQQYLINNGVRSDLIRTNIAVVDSGSVPLDLPSDNIWLRVFYLKN